MKFKYGTVLLGVLMMTLPLNARADDEDKDKTTHIGVDLDYAAVIEDGEVESGTGFGVRVGREFDIILLTLIPEIGGDYHTFGTLDANVYRGFLGGRLRLGKILEPGVYAHAGFGKLSVDTKPDYSRTAPSLDAGITLDLTLLPLVDIGAHAGYAVMLKDSDNPAFDWWVAGLHAALVF